MDKKDGYSAIILQFRGGVHVIAGRRKESRNRHWSKTSTIRLDVGRGCGTNGGVLGKSRFIPSTSFHIIHDSNEA